MIDIGTLSESPFSKMHSLGVVLKYPFHVNLTKRVSRVDCPKLN